MIETERQIDGLLASEDARPRFAWLASQRSAVLAAFVAASVAAFWGPLRTLYTVSRGSGEYSYLLLIPIMVLGLFYIERERIFRGLRYSLRAGLPVIAAGAAIALAATAWTSGSGPSMRLFLQILGLVTIWMGVFLLCCGGTASRAGIFDLLCLLFFVPLPQAQMAAPVSFVQHASADVTSFLFALFRVPVFREGLTFNMTHLTFIVAQECSGFHSITALVICAVLGGHFYFRSNGKKLILALIALPIVAFTNGLRIFILAVLAVYVDMAFFYGNLHRKGGSIFFLLGVVILYFAAKLLRRLRVRRPVGPHSSESAPSAL